MTVQKIIPPAPFFLAGFAALLVVLFGYFQYSTNIPWYDDYQTSLKLVMNFDDASSWPERIRLLFKRHSTHIVLIPNLANIIDWKLFGVLNLRHLVLAASVFFCVAIVLLQLQIRAKHKSLHAMTVALLCINLLTYACTLWPITSMQNYSVMVLVAAALWLLSKPGNICLCIAAAMITLATFSSGHGMLGFIAGAVVLLATGRPYKWVLGWSAFGILVVLFFFHIFANKGFKVVRANPELTTLVIYYLTFIGSIIQIIPYAARLAPVVGVLLLAICLWLLHKKYYQKNPSLFGWIVFMLITSGAVTLSRCGHPFSPALDSRYAVNSCVLVALLYVALVELYDNYLKRSHAIIFCLMAIGFSAITSYSYLPVLAERQQRLMTGAQLYIDKADPSGLVSTDTEVAASILTEAARRNIYHIEAGLK